MTDLFERLRCPKCGGIVSPMIKDVQPQDEDGVGDFMARLGMWCDVCEEEVREARSAPGESWDDVRWGGEPRPPATA